jgi:hypothetical protein
VHSLVIVQIVVVETQRLLLHNIKSVDLGPGGVRMMNIRVGSNGKPMQ